MHQRWPLYCVSCWLITACSSPRDANLFDDIPTTVGVGTSTDGAVVTTTGDTSASVGGSAASGNGGSMSSVGGAGGAAGASVDATGGVGGGATTSDGSGGGPSSGGSRSGGSGGSGGGSGGSTECVAEDEACDGRDNDCDGQVDEAGVCPIRCTGASFEDHAYLFCDAPPAASGDRRRQRTWWQALQFCLERGQHLARVESAEENEFIYLRLVALDGEDDAWMGATDQEREGLWSWAVSDESQQWSPFYDGSTKQPIEQAFNDWREGEPNDMGGEDCGIFDEVGDDVWEWDDRACDTEFARFVCESSSAPSAN